MKHIEIRQNPKRELQLVALVVFIYTSYAGISGVVYKLQYLESRFVRLSVEPGEYWSILYLYTAGGVLMFVYSVVGFPKLEHYFQNAQRKQNKELENRTINQKIFVYFIAPVIIFAALSGFYIYANR
ncbi:hypothetical protein MO867_21820 [Microbulbifer sp. OS29]|uniref:Uncharacterized protein n=1 Tax=Microbulbifer okhotskensis TaxID=2926617 RepID=A0A9X2EW11_9GAMM|nr:hypothetical protein [Microbulbifer okhotskensis]MCO1336966.1 hypothetical protein [Microbulbifer okhotskensis]